MGSTPNSVAEFLRGRRIGVAGVSRNRMQPANVIYRKLRDMGHEVFPVNPAAAEVEDAACYPDIASLPEGIDGIVVATHPAAAVDVIRQCGERGIARVWFHRSFGAGSVSPEAVRECGKWGIDAIVGGCPLMFCEPVDIAHKCMKWWLQRRGRVPR
jgi:predicted CoA-binding protein